MLLLDSNSAPRDRQTTSPAARPCIVLLAGDGEPTCMVYHALAQRFASTARLEVILERPMSRLELVKRRAKRLGIGPVLGHVLFMALALPVLRMRGRKRVAAIKAEHKLDDSPIAEPAFRVTSANGAAVIERLQALTPAVVVVNGTRILSSEVLRSVPAPFINMHAGVTPAYRGVHGGYWALAEGKPELAGTTIHLVDEGIDTGEVIRQIPFTPTPADNFSTYPYLHTATGLPALLDAVGAVLSGERPARCIPGCHGSQLRYHPTLWSYLTIGCRRNVW